MGQTGLSEEGNVTMAIDTMIAKHQLLTDLVGRYLICELFIPPNIFYICDGVLVQVTEEFFILYDEGLDAKIAYTIEPLKVISQFPPRLRPMHDCWEDKCKYLEQLKTHQRCSIQILPNITTSAHYTALAHDMEQAT